MTNQEAKKTIRFRGNNIILMGKDPNNFGPGALVHIDANGDGTFEHRTLTDADGLYTIGIDMPSIQETGKDGPSPTEPCYEPGNAGGDKPFTELAMYITSADEGREGPVEILHCIREAPENLAAAVPVNLVPPELVVPGKTEKPLKQPPVEKLPPGIPEEKLIPVEPGICTCTTCSDNDTLTGSSTDGFAQSNTPTEHQVELATGKLRQQFPLTSFPSRIQGFNMGFYHISMTDYNGPWGQSISHSFNMMMIRNDDQYGQIVTSELRCYNIYSDDGETWKLPCGFFSRLTLDRELHRWTLTHFSGLEIVFFEGAPGMPGYPMSISEPNGNTIRLKYNLSGTLQRIITDLNQHQKLTYGPDGRLNAFTDHIHRQWKTIHDAGGRLVQIKAPGTEYADIPAYTEITEKDLDNVLKFQPRVWTLGYADDPFPNHIRSVTDPRGETPEAYDYDQYGRVSTAWINEKPVRYQYQSGNPEFSFPIDLDPLEATNLCTVVTDREGNVNLYEIHGAAGGPLNENSYFYNEHGRILDGEGRFGLRRQITLTESGKGNEPLRPDEPLYWEQRWLHDCDCLSPVVTTEPFRNDEAGLEFDGYGIPLNYPIDTFAYNRNRQVTRQQRTDGTDFIITQYTYQPYAFGDRQQFSRPLTMTEPRAFDGNPIYAGLSFEHTYSYDEFGNRTSHEAPTVTRGVDTPQCIIDTWTYNESGQMLVHTDPNCNLTVNTYFDGPSTGGDINTRGQFGGYLGSVTRGADGSFDAPANLATSYKVNPLGMVTQMTDPNGFSYRTVFNNLQETTHEMKPPVTLCNGRQVQYETRTIYDGAGNPVMERRSNIDQDGNKPDNDWIDQSRSFDPVNNMRSERVEVDADDANDLIHRYAYDGNDDRWVTRKPEGNGEQIMYDERRLPFKRFYGVAAVDSIDEALPADKRANSLGNTSFVGLEINTYDARKNLWKKRDGRGNMWFSFFDFRDRQFSISDPNGNGWKHEFDDDSNIITESRGVVSATTGEITELLERTYKRYDEIGRLIRMVRDIDLDTDESRDVNPDDGKNSSYLTIHDPGSRVVRSIDANNNARRVSYDAADREVTLTDALNNRRVHAYDDNSNVIRITDLEVPGPGTAGDEEIYVMTMAYDELNRRIEQHILGLNGNSIDHGWFFAFDSRNNQRDIQDAEGNFTRNTLDDQDRLILMQRFDGDPAVGNPIELLHSEWTYDKNSNTTKESALSDVTDTGSLQTTRCAYDALDRKVRTVYPDSDDPIDGSGNGTDGIYDRVEVVYDENSNPVQVTDQREVVFKTTFDPGNRPVEQKIILPDDVPGTTRQTFTYDALDRTTRAKNNYANIDLTYDAFSRPVKDRQSIRLDGSGFSKSYEKPVTLVYQYDKQSNRTGYQVIEGRKQDLNIAQTFDALNRTDGISAAYFDKPLRPMVNYNYLGPGRVTHKTLGNGAVLRCAYDAKRRVRSHQWNGPNRLLAGFEYGYDRMDNALYEGFTHDQGRYDHFQYNDRYEVTRVSYRVPGSIAPADPVNTFDYDDLFNRRQADFGQPFEEAATTSDQYVINKANEYTQLTRNGNATTPMHDRAGNATGFLTRPITGNSDRKDVTANARWDAYNLLFDIDPGGVNPKQDYRYDPMRRRIVTLELDGDKIASGSKRYIYDGWRVVEERYCEEKATLAKAPSVLERIYVNGMGIDEPVLAAIDGNRDGAIGEGNAKNVPQPEADQEYYFLNNRLGSIMAVLDADNPDHVIEYYRHSSYGQSTVLPLLDEDDDGLEDTPLDLSDNVDESLPNISQFGNIYLFTARRFDEKTGLYYYRYRYYEPISGRFINRDPISNYGGANLYSYVNGNPASYIDPSGLIKVSLEFWDKDLKWDNKIGDAEWEYEVSCDKDGNVNIGPIDDKSSESTSFWWGDSKVQLNKSVGFFKGCKSGSGKTVLLKANISTNGGYASWGVSVIFGLALAPVGAIVGGIAVGAGVFALTGNPFAAAAGAGVGYATGGIAGTVGGAYLGPIATDWWVASDAEITIKKHYCCCSKIEWVTQGDSIAVQNLFCGGVDEVRQDVTHNAGEAYMKLNYPISFCTYERQLSRTLK